MDGVVDESLVRLTDASGNYVFTGLGPADYSVREVLKAGFEQTAPATGSFAGTVTSGLVLNADFGNARTLAFDKDSPAQYGDASGDLITVSLKGLGNGKVVLPASGVGDAINIFTWDTSSSSKLTVKTGRGDTTIVNMIVNGSLRDLLAKTTDLLGDLTVAGALMKLQLDDVADNHEITIGPPESEGDTLTVTMDRVADLTFTSQTPIKAFTVSEWLDTDDDPDQLITPWVKTLKSQGNRSVSGVDGDFEAGLVLSGVGAPRYTLGTASIYGDLGSGDPGGPGDPVEWDITGDVSTIDASKGTVEGWTLDLHSNIKALKLGLVEQAEVSVGNATTVSASQWNDGAISGASIKTFTTKANSKLAGADGDVKVAMTLAGSAGASTLGSAKIAGDLGSGDAPNPIEWDITGDVGSIDASKGSVEGWTLNVNSNIKSMKLGLVTNASVDVDGGILALAVSDWLAGSIHADYIKSLKSSGDKKVGTAGDFRAVLTLDGSASPGIKATLTSAKIAGDLGSGDALSPIAWDISGDVGAIDASKGTVEGWTLDLHSNVKSLKLGFVEQAALTIAGDVGAISASQWNQGDIRADSIKSLGTKSNSKVPGADGDFKADIQLTGSADAKLTTTLGSAKIAGRIFGAFWEILTGDIGAITAGIIDTSTIRAGIDPALAPTTMPDVGGADFTSQSTIASVTVKGIKSLPAGTPTYLNSIIAAWELGKLKLDVVKTDNAGIDFGLAADFIGAVDAEKPDGTRFPKLSALDTPADIPVGFDFEDFRLVLIDP